VHIYIYTQKYSFGDCERGAICGEGAFTHSRCVLNIHVSIYAKQINGCIWSIYTVIDEDTPSAVIANPSTHSRCSLNIHVCIYAKNINGYIWTKYTVIERDKSAVIAHPHTHMHTYPWICREYIYRHIYAVYRERGA